MPAPDTIRTSRKIAFNKRYRGGVEVRYGYSQTEVRHQVVLWVDHAVEGEVDISFGILGKGDVTQHVLSVIALRELCHCAQGVQGITGGLDPHGELGIGAIREALVVRTERTCITPVHDELVLITGA